MTGSDALHILLGAALVAIGVIAAAVAPALADRIRGGRAPREIAPRERASRERSAQAHAARTSIPVVASADLLRTPVSKAPPAPCNTDGGGDVIAALVAAGYKKPIATEATWACNSAERATVESWTAAALRRCARGGMS